MAIDKKRLIITFLCVLLFIVLPIILLVVFLPKSNSEPVNDNKKRYLAIFKDGQDLDSINFKLMENNIKVVIYHDNIAAEILISDDEANKIRYLFKTLTYKKMEPLGDYNQKQIDIINIWNGSFEIPKSNIRGPIDWHPPFTTMLPEEFAMFMLKNNIIDNNEYNYILKDKDPRMVKTSLYTTSNAIKTMYKNNVKLNRSQYEKIKDSLSSLLLSVPKNLWDKIIDKFNQLDLPKTKLFLTNATGTCRKMTGKIAVGVVFVNSSLKTGPVFPSSEQNTLSSSVIKAQTALTTAHPTKNITWYNNIQNVKIDVVNGPEVPYGSKISFYTYDDYWRDPAIKKIVFNGKSYTSVTDYLNDLKNYYSCDYAICCFFTPYETSYPAYASSSKAAFTMSNNKNYVGWGLDNAWKVVTHEICHLFGAPDEYVSDVGTSCTSCTSTHGCNQFQNRNCQACAKYPTGCVMIDNDPESFCAYTQGQLGWVNEIIQIEIKVKDVIFAGTDNDVYINFKTNTGQKSYLLNNSWVNDFERNKTSGFVLGISLSDIIDPTKYYIEIKPFLGIVNSLYIETIKIYRNNVLIKDDTVNAWLTSKNKTWPSPMPF